MPIRFTCPGCSKTFNAPDKAAGKQIQCPSCSTALVVPGGAVAAAPPAAPVYVEAPPAPQVHYHVGGQPAGPGKGMAIAGMVLGIVGFVLSFIPCIGLLLGGILGILGAVFSGIGLATALKIQEGKGMAITGLALSVLAIIWVPIWWAICVAIFTHNVNDAFQKAADDLKNHPPSIQINPPPGNPNKP